MGHEVGLGDRPLAGSEDRKRLAPTPTRQRVEYGVSDRPSETFASKRLR
ncbi:hypothetical protein [Halorussus caseinilyticus]|uniref:Uncharacterized protein n=1 Tax=Halorussus caseinilyticus TaxID=3034025 RepID=A0ABD5WRJ6_9EURY